MPKHFNPAAFYVPIPSQLFLASLCFVMFSISINFYAAGVNRRNYFAVYLYDVLLG